ncbi:hypothetical protein Nepgr_029641 [Nepenthes gracilis]|uniref:Uncharacterized protein n=1 Tax=Nepenthes gracilis TaxID=150966 RepID=A0AAD3TCU3_NEPGR|nr:hypothetical protein Nepgr_029641 [Nepenthes gracilis]
MQRRKKFAKSIPVNQPNGSITNISAEKNRLLQPPLEAVEADYCWLQPWEDIAFGHNIRSSSLLTGPNDNSSGDHELIEIRERRPAIGHQNAGLLCKTKCWPAFVR